MTGQPNSISVSQFDSLIVEERLDQIMEGGVVRIYRLANGYGLSAINSPRARRFPYAWEFAVLEPWEQDPLGLGDVVFDTPLTSTIEVCRTEREAAEFLTKAVQWASTSNVFDPLSTPEDAQQQLVRTQTTTTTTAF